MMLRLVAFTLGLGAAIVIAVPNAQSGMSLPHSVDNPRLLLHGVMLKDDVDPASLARLADADCRPHPQSKRYICSEEGNDLNAVMVVTGQGFADPDFPIYSGLQAPADPAALVPES
jgi:hypothetical protein